MREIVSPREQRVKRAQPPVSVARITRGYVARKRELGLPRRGFKPHADIGGKRPGRDVDTAVIAELVNALDIPEQLSALPKPARADGHPVLVSRAFDRAARLELRKQRVDIEVSDRRRSAGVNAGEKITLGHRIVEDPSRSNLDFAQGHRLHFEFIDPGDRAHAVPGSLDVCPVAVAHKPIGAQPQLLPTHTYKRVLRPNLDIGFLDIEIVALDRFECITGQKGALHGNPRTKIGSELRIGGDLRALGEKPAIVRIVGVEIDVVRVSQAFAQQTREFDVDGRFVFRRKRRCANGKDGQRRAVKCAHQLSPGRTVFTSWTARSVTIVPRNWKSAQENGGAGRAPGGDWRGRARLCGSGYSAGTGASRSPCSTRSGAS